jgi:hypothetical protein
MVEAVDVKFSNVLPVYTKIYKLQLQIHVIATTVDSSKTLLTVAECFRSSRTAPNCIQQESFFISVDMVYFFCYFRATVPPHCRPE